MQEELFNSLNGDEGLQGRFTPVIMRRLKSLGGESLRVAEELTRRLEVLLAVAARTKHAERLTDTYEQAHNRASAERELRDIIEGIARPVDASLP